MSEDATSTSSREVNAGSAPVQATDRWSRLLSLALAQLRRLALTWPPHVARSEQFSGVPCSCMKLGCLLKPRLENKVVCGAAFEK